MPEGICAFCEVNPPTKTVKMFFDIEANVCDECADRLARRLRH